MPSAVDPSRKLPSAAEQISPQEVTDFLLVWEKKKNPSLFKPENNCWRGFKFLLFLLIMKCCPEETLDNKETSY